MWVDPRMQGITTEVSARLLSKMAVSTPSGSGPGSHFVIASAEQLVDRFRAFLHLLGGRREAGASHPTADEPPLPGRRPIPGQHVTHSRMAPPPGSRSRDRIDSCSYATPDPIHPASA